MRLAVLSLVLLGGLAIPCGSGFGDLQAADASWSLIRGPLLPPPLLDPARNPATQRLLRSRTPASKTLSSLTGCEWWLWFDEPSGVPRLALSSGWWIRDGGVAEDELRGIAEEVIERIGGCFGVGTESLVYADTETVGELRRVRFDQRRAGVPVSGGFFHVCFFQRRDGLVVTRVGGHFFPELSIDVHPELSPGRASSIAAAGVPEHRISRVHDPRLEIIPVRHEQRSVPTLAYRVRIEADAPRADYHWLIDASSGEVLQLFDDVRRVDLPGNVAGWATPGLVPDLPGVAEDLVPLAFLRVIGSGGVTALTNDDGDFLLQYPPGSGPVDATLRLAGPHVDVNTALGPDLEFTVTLDPAVPTSVIFGDGLTDSEVAQVNAFIHVNRVHDYLVGIDPSFDLLDFPIICNVDLDDECNAFYTSGTLNFHAAGGGCPSTAFSTVIYHEYGHAVVDGIYPFVPDPRYNEGVADVCATFLTDDPVIGADFYGPGTVIRDVEASDRRFPDDLALESHEAGLIVAGAFWDLRMALTPVLGSGPALDLCREFYLHHHYFLTGEISPELTIDLLTLDDDNGNLLDGTPHHAEIQASFSAHGLPGPDLLAFEFEHDELADGLPTDVAARIVPLIGSTVEQAELVYQVDAEPAVIVVMTPTGVPDEYHAALPILPTPAVLRYSIRAVDDLGFEGTVPASAPAGTFDTLLGTVSVRYSEPVGTGDAGIQHSAVMGPDDWQRGPPNPGGVNLWDPVEAYSAPRVWGNDLGSPGFDGNYESDSINSLELPALDLSLSTGTHLQFHRWLTLAGGGDWARILVNDIEIWSNPPGSSVVDDAWLERTFDISALADGNPEVRIRFELESDGVVELGGWNLDDFRVVSLTAWVPPSFLRGDFDANGTLDLADAIGILGLLFVPGAPSVSCLDRADVDDSGDLDLADGWYLLDHLFLAGPVPPAPSGTPGPDPTDDSLPCP